MGGGLVSTAKERELTARNKFRVFDPVEDTHWPLAWKMTESRMNARVRLAAKGNQDPDLRDGSVDTSGRVRLRSSRLQVISLGATGK